MRSVARCGFIEILLAGAGVSGPRSSPGRSIPFGDEVFDELELLAGRTKDAVFGIDGRCDSGLKPGTAGCKRRRYRVRAEVGQGHDVRGHRGRLAILAGVGERPAAEFR